MSRPVRRTSVAARRAARRAEQARTPYASNWRSVLLADAAVGLVILVVGLVVLGFLNIFAGAGIGALGVVYVAMVVRRYRYWRELRRDAGLDG